ncbi:hypothetical protein OKW96_14985 [Sphingobacterium sp. KU25419]|nr:hypothetical protein OKW96_14985 [Sphingobacterium sp. KU25419]
MFPEKDLLPHHDHSHNPYKDEISSSSTRGISLRNLKPALLLLELRAKETENVTHLNKKAFGTSYALIYYKYILIGGG